MLDEKKLRLPSLLVLFSLLLVNPYLAARAQVGWYEAGSKPQSYAMGTDSEVSRSGHASAFIRSKDENSINGFGTLMQDVAPDRYRGHRVRLAGYVKSDGVEGWAGLWMRVDPANRASGGRSLAFDNMQRRPVVGTNDWKYCEVVLDIAEEAANIAFGFLLVEKGSIWVDSLTLEIVSEDIPVTDIFTERSDTPKNLDFEE